MVNVLSTLPTVNCAEFVSSIKISIYNIFRYLREMILILLLLSYCQYYVKNSFDNEHSWDPSAVKQSSRKKKK
ncbi:hypothetical protein V1477_003545 [Vespula maculifrons]|uniref:Uncharacterized protein n=1 Tax=Vespula maculifrons TaxID=7453 RepID=A0ABD2CT18_VESMC